MFHLSTRAICLVSASLLAMHAFSQDISNWTDKTVCRLVESDAGAIYLEEAISRDLACRASIRAPKQPQSFISIKVKF